jgi:hypothetical protein
MAATPTTTAATMRAWSMPLTNDVRDAEERAWQKGAGHTPGHRLGAAHRPEDQSSDASGD